MKYLVQKYAIWDTPMASTAPQMRLRSISCTALHWTISRWLFISLLVSSKDQRRGKKMEISTYIFSSCVARSFAFSSGFWCEIHVALVMSQPLKIETRFSASPPIQDNHCCAVVFLTFFFFFALKTQFMKGKEMNFQRISNKKTPLLQLTPHLLFNEHGDFAK